MSPCHETCGEGMNCSRSVDGWPLDRALRLNSSPFASFESSRSMRLIDARVSQPVGQAPIWAASLTSSSMAVTSNRPLARFAPTAHLCDS
jgi:hypothetical protein